MPNPIINRRVVLSGNSYSPAAQAYFNTLSTQPSGLQKQRLDNYLFKPFVATGIYNESDRILVFASEIQENGLVSLVNPTATKATEVNSPTWTQYQGYDFNGTTQYINSQAVLNTLTKYTLDSTSVWIYVRENAQGNADYGATGAAGANNSSLWTRFTDDKAYWSANDTGAASNVSNTDSRGLFHVVRSANNLITVYKNGVSIATSADPSTAVAVVAMYIGAQNANGTAANFGNKQIAAWGIGSKNIDPPTLYTIIQGYMTQIGANV